MVTFATLKYHDMYSCLTPILSPFYQLSVQLNDVWGYFAQMECHVHLSIWKATSDRIEVVVLSYHPQLIMKGNNAMNLS